jgi:hypothetical protein
MDEAWKLLDSVSRFHHDRNRMGWLADNTLNKSWFVLLFLKLEM